MRECYLVALHRARARAITCATQSGPDGEGEVQYRIESSGAFADVSVRGRFAGTAVGTCVEESFASARVPPFRGPMPINTGFSVLPFGERAFDYDAARRALLARDLRACGVLAEGHGNYHLHVQFSPDGTVGSFEPLSILYPSTVACLQRELSSFRVQPFSPAQTNAPYSKPTVVLLHTVSKAAGHYEIPKR